MNMRGKRLKQKSKFSIRTAWITIKNDSQTEKKNKCEEPKTVLSFVNKSKRKMSQSSCAALAVSNGDGGGGRGAGEF